MFAQKKQVSNIL